MQGFRVCWDDGEAHYAATGPGIYATQHAYALGMSPVNYQVPLHYELAYDAGPVL